MTILKNYYEILGVRQTCPDADIKAAYRELARRYHPDLGGDAERFDEICEAYRNLSDKSKRLAFDVRLRAAARSSANGEMPDKHVSRHDGAEKSASERSRPCGATDRERMLEEQIAEYEKLLTEISRCTVTPMRPEISPQTLAMIIRRNRAARGR